MPSTYILRGWNFFNSYLTMFVLVTTKLYLCQSRSPYLFIVHSLQTTYCIQKYCTLAYSGINTRTVKGTAVMHTTVIVFRVCNLYQAGSSVICRFFLNLFCISRKRILAIIVFIERFDRSTLVPSSRQTFQFKIRFLFDFSIKKNPSIQRILGLFFPFYWIVIWQRVVLRVITYFFSISTSSITDSILPLVD